MEIGQEYSWKYPSRMALRHVLLGLLWTKFIHHHTFPWSFVMFLRASTPRIQEVNLTFGALGFIG